MKRTHTFTLIELLAVILIIAILSAMLFGGAALVQKITRRTACANNLRDIMMSMKVYSANTTSQLFPGPTPWGIENKNVTTDDVLLKENNATLTAKQMKRDYYDSSDDIVVKGWVCPTDQDGTFSVDGTEKYRRSYIFNASFKGGVKATDSIAEIDINAPARTVAWMDAHYGPEVLLGGAHKSVIHKYDDFKNLVSYWSEQKIGIHGKANDLDVNVVMYDGSLQRFNNSRFTKENQKKTFDKFMYLNGK